MEGGSRLTLLPSVVYGWTRYTYLASRCSKTCQEVQSHSVSISREFSSCATHLLTATAATFGALLFSPNPSLDITLVLKPGHDFPPQLLRTFKSWAVDLHTLSSSTAPSARGRILYGTSASERTYERLTPPRNTSLADLLITGAAAAKCFHLFDTAAETVKWVSRLLLVQKQHELTEPPLFVWEPQAKSCSLNTFEEHRAVAAKVTVFSPNHAELAQFFPRHGSGHPAQFSREVVEEQAHAFLPASSGTSDAAKIGPCIIIRCAEQGCYVLPSPATVGTWLPPYHGAESAHKVVDPTGAGNAFLGGAAMSLLQNGGDFVQAAKYGSVSASFAVECVGLPDPESCDARERLAEMEQKHS